MILSIFLCAYWPFVYLWKNVSSNPLPTFKLCCLSSDRLQVFFIFSYPFFCGFSYWWSTWASKILNIEFQILTCTLVWLAWIKPLLSISMLPACSHLVYRGFVLSTVLGIHLGLETLAKDKGVLHAFWMLVTYHVYDLQIFFPFHSTFFILSFEVQTFLVCIKSCWSVFLVAYIFGIMFKKIWFNSEWQIYCHVLF